ncbi:MAG TPA: 3-oxoacyl-ACP synthase [Lentisphaeria bacterium]|nr:MAG: 3-oxoacyl-ACP synthase [Lentisphaerae bacterium GWF2_38_69]HBM16473.1 3-oxoacyl-ACP synthase [Lentisphaeria bacterium]
MGIRITGIGSYAPDRILTNQDLEKMVETSDDWITTRTGIKERRIAKDDETTSDMGTNAARKAMEMAGVAPDEIDLIVFATITADTRLPSAACHTQRKLNIRSSAACFDFQAACSGTVYGIEIVTAMMKCSRSYKKAILIGCERLSSVTDWTDRNSCVLFGDGAASFVFEKTKEPGDTLLSSIIKADGAESEILCIPGGGTQTPITPENYDKKLQFLKMEGNKVFKLAVNAMVNTSNEAIDLARLKSSDINWLIPHQANMRIINAIGTRLGISNDRVITNLSKYGNTSAASIGIALDEAVRSGKVKKGDLLLLTAFGGGMTWGSSILRW